MSQLPLVHYFLPITNVMRKSGILFDVPLFIRPNELVSIFYTKNRLLDTRTPDVHFVNLGVWFVNTKTLYKLQT